LIALIFSLVYKILFMFILSTTLFLAASLISASAQMLPQSNSPTTASSSSASIDNPYGLRITDPARGETFYINNTNYYDVSGKKLTLNGISVADNGNLTGCDVSIVANNVFPYQAANATGPQGEKDFSKWDYTFSSNYANLHEGSNKITSKLTCEAGSAKAYYSINVTGVTFNGTLPQTSQTAEMDLQAMSVEILSPKNGETVNITGPITVSGSSDYPQNYDCEVLLAEGNSDVVIAPTSSNNSNFKKTLAKGVNGSGDFRDWSLVLEPGNNNLKNGSQSLTAKLQCYSPLSAVKLAKVNVDAILPPPPELKTMDVSIDKTGQGLGQRIIIGANDATTSESLEGTIITGSINGQKFSGATDTDGKYTASLPASLLESGETINVSVTVTKDGYKLKKTSTSFEGTPVDAETGTTASTPSPSSDETNNEAELADKIFDDVQKQLSDQGINIPLPFG
jgi:hypothetical protein